MRLLWVVLVAGAVAAGVMLPATARSGEESPADRLFAVGQALNHGDVDAVVAMFAPDGSVVAVTQGGEDFVGPDRIRVWAQRLVDGHFHVEFPANPEVSGNRVTWFSLLWLDQWRNLGVAPAEVIVQVTVEDDLVKTFSSSVSRESQAGLDAGAAKSGLVDRLFIALNAGDIEATVALLTDDVFIQGALGDRIHGIEEARAYYTRLIAGHLELRPAMAWIVSGDRVSGVYGLGVDSLRGVGVASAETIGDFYIRGGKVAGIVARFTPNSAAAVAATR